MYHDSTCVDASAHFCFSLTQGGEGRAASRTTTLFKLLPSVECVSPRHLNAVQLQRKEYAPLPSPLLNSLLIPFFS